LDQGVTKDSQNSERIFPVTIEEWERNSREVVRIPHDRYNGQFIVNIRIWWYDENEQLKPGKSGLTLAVKHRPALEQDLSDPAGAARQMSLMSDGGEQ
jgi:hypothetical protein